MTNIPHGTLKLTLDDGTTIEATPLKVTFHATAEHTIDDRVMDLEVQIYHEDADGGLVIVSILYVRKRSDLGEDPFLKEFMGSN